MEDGELLDPLNQKISPLIQINTLDQNDDPAHPHARLVRSKQEKLGKRVLFAMDVFLASFFITPLVVGCWRGAWSILDIRGGKYLPPIPSGLLALSILFVFTLLRDIIQEESDKPSKFPMGWMILKKVYLEFFLILGLMHWRAVWLTVDGLSGIVYTSDGRADGNYDTSVAIYLAIIGVVCLVPLRGLRNGVASPFAVAVDDDKNFIYPTRFKREMMQGTSWYILDCLFSVIVVGTLVVLVWRGVWVLMDIYIYPDEPTWSAWGSTIIGYSIVAVAFSLQPLMRWVCDRIDGCWRLLACDLFLLFALVGTVNVWRGIWLLLNFYFLPDDLELSCWITHWTSLVLLILMGCSNSLLVRGVFIDAEEPAGKCVVFPCYYLRLIFQQERERKKQAQIELMAQRKLEMEKSNHHNPVRINMDANNHM